MAKYEKQLIGNFDEVLDTVHRAVMSGASASFEDASDWQTENGARAAVRVYERYSWIGSNRVSLNVTLIGDEDRLFLTLITSGGSQAVLFKINTIGEESFLSKVQRAVEDYLAKNGQ